MRTPTVRRTLMVVAYGVVILGFATAGFGAGPRATLT
jgi:hypothetical protein